MEELDFHRPELDGRNQCESQADVVFPNGKRPRCIGEKDHTLDHAGDGFYWTEEEAFKPATWHVKNELKYFMALFWVILGGSTLYAIYQIVTDVTSDVPFWWYFTAYGSAAALIAISIYRGKR